MTVKVEFGYAKQGEGGIPQYNDISADVIGVSVNRGKDPQQDTFNAASCSITLQNDSRNYDPTYGPSPYQGQIVPTGQVKVYKDAQIIFTGFITDWNFTYEPSGESIAEIVATDAFGNLNNQTLTDYAPIEQLSSARILSVLARPEVGGSFSWPASQRVISTGVATMGDYAVNDGTNVLSYLQEVEKSEPGRLFIDKQGRIVFRSRNNDLQNPDYEYTRLNLSANPSFENNITSWSSTIGGLTRSTADAYIGTASGLVAAGAGAEQYFTSEIGVTYTVSLYAKTVSGSAVVEFCGLTSSDGSSFSLVNKITQTITSTEWTRLYTSFDAVSVYSGLRLLQNPSSNSVYIDAVLIEATPVIDAYFDGANAPVYNYSNPEAPDYQPARAFESYDPEWVLG